MIRVCFVCLGNICRSPTAEGVMQAIVEREGLSHAIEVDSAGTGGWHAGEPADKRARQSAKRRGYALNSRARQVDPADFENFHYVVAMDTSNYRDLQGLVPHDGVAGNLFLFRDFDPQSPKGADVPDPYYGGERGFENVLDMVERGCEELLRHIRDNHGM